MLDVVIGLEDYSFFLGQTVLGEIIELRGFVENRIGDGRIVLLPDDALTFDEVADFADQHSLGLGESECILFCVQRPDLDICSDDRRARRIASDALGAARVVGTADLLKECVRQGLSTPQDAFAAYEQMRARGAFLPVLSREEFIV